MAKQHVAEQETLGEAMNKTEFFFEKNGRMLSYVFLGLLVLAALVFGYRALIVSPRAEKAAEMIAEAQYRFEDQNADYALALEGDANGAGFLEVIEKYGSTPSGNLAKHYAGICYLKAGDLENAAKFLARYSPVKGIPGALINAQNYGLQGDIAVEQKDATYAAIRNIEFVKYHVFPDGYMMRVAPESSREQIRVSKKAIKKGISFYKVGCDFIRQYKKNPNSTNVRVSFITKNVDFKTLHVTAKKIDDVTKTMNTILEGMPEDLDCASCSFKPVCDEVEGLKELHFGKAGKKAPKA